MRLCQTLFWLIAFLALASGTDPVNIHVATFFNDREAALASQLAVDVINNHTDGLYDDILRGFNITNTFYKDGCNEQDALGAAMSATFGRNMAGEPDLVGVAGTECSSSTMEASRFFNILPTPMVSGLATHVDLSDDSKFPYFSRVCPSDAAQGRMLAVLMDTLGIHYVATIVQNTDYALGIADIFKNELLSLDSHNRIVFDSTFSASSNLVQLLTNAANSGARVIMVSSDYDEAAWVMSTAVENDVLVDPQKYIWVGVDAWTVDSLIREYPEILPAVEGAVGTQFVDGEGWGADAFYEGWAEAVTTGRWDYLEEQHGLSDRDGDPTTLIGYAPYLYDAMLAILMGVNQSVYLGSDYMDAGILTHTIESVSFMGASGEIMYTDQGDREPAFKIVNVQNGTFVTSAVWGEEFEFVTDIVYPNGDSYPEHLFTDSSCQNFCSGRGNCNEQTVTCSCYNGYAGSGCEFEKPLSLTNEWKDSTSLCLVEEMYDLNVETEYAELQLSPCVPIHLNIGNIVYEFDFSEPNCTYIFPDDLESLDYTGGSIKDALVVVPELDSSCSAYQIRRLEKDCHTGQEIDVETSLCIDCQEGYYSNQTTDYVCTPCPAGYYSPAVSAFCLECTTGYSSEASAGCQACPHDRVVSVSGATSEEQCECAPGYYDVYRKYNSSSESKCIECVDYYAQCPGGINEPIIEEGYWVEDADELVFLRCYPGRCEGGVGVTECANGHTGRKCATCKPGYWMFSSECVRCPERASTLSYFVKATLVLLMWLPVMRLLAINLPVMYHILSYCQVLGLIFQFNVPWPDEIRPVVGYIQVLSFNVHMTQYECYSDDYTAEELFFAEWGTYMALPVAYFMIIVAKLLLTYLYTSCGTLLTPHLVRRFPRFVDRLGSYYAVRWVLWAFGPGDWDSYEVYKNRMIAFYMFLLNLTYIPSIQNSMSVFACEVYTSDGTAFISKFPEIDCHGATYTFASVVGVFGVLTYLLGVPFLFMYVVSQRNTAVTHRQRFGFLYSRFEKEWSLWEMVTILRRISVSILRTFLQFDPPFQAMLTMLVLGINIAAQFYARPFQEDRYDVLECVLLLDLFIWVQLGVLFGIGSDYPHVWYDPSKDYVYLLPLIVFLLGVVAMLIVLARDMENVIDRFRRGLYDIFDENADGVITGDEVLRGIKRRFRERKNSIWQGRLNSSQADHHTQMEVVAVHTDGPKYRVNKALQSADEADGASPHCYIPGEGDRDGKGEQRKSRERLQGLQNTTGMGMHSPLDRAASSGPSSLVSFADGTRQRGGGGGGGGGGDVVPASDKPAAPPAEKARLGPGGRTRPTSPVFRYQPDVTRNKRLTRTLSGPVVEEECSAKLDNSLCDSSGILGINGTLRMHSLPRHTTRQFVVDVDGGPECLTSRSLSRPDVAAALPRSAVETQGLPLPVVGVAASCPLGQRQAAAGESSERVVPGATHGPSSMTGGDSLLVFNNTASRASVREGSGGPMGNSTLAGRPVPSSPWAVRAPKSEAVETGETASAATVELNLRQVTSPGKKVAWGQSDQPFNGPAFHERSLDRTSSSPNLTSAPKARSGAFTSFRLTRIPPATFPSAATAVSPPSASSSTRAAAQPNGATNGPAKTGSEGAAGAVSGPTALSRQHQWLGGGRPGSDASLLQNSQTRKRRSQLKDLKARSFVKGRASPQRLVPINPPSPQNTK
eukprot:Rmarinus@m.10452